MMDEAQFGTRDKRGHWKPDKLIAYPPVFVWPPKPFGILKWLLGVPGYLLPGNLFYAMLAIVIWLFFTPPLETMATLAPGWIAYVFVRNLVLACAIFGSLHVRLMVRKTQGQQFKYNPLWQDTDHPVFLFRNQTVDNMVWSLCSGVPIWTAYEVLTLWAFANGIIPFLSWEQHPVFFVALMLAIPLIREVHFYAVHRLIHWPPLYRTVHKLHHYNVNPGPWSGLAMHPGEHLLYFSGILIHWIIPSHPIHALFHVLHAGLTPALAHTGFDRVRFGKGHSLRAEGYAHYLHHKYFECNYADGTLPLDKWAGSFHDGSEAAHEAMNARFLAQAAKKQGN